MRAWMAILAAVLVVGVVAAVGLRSTSPAGGPAMSLAGVDPLQTARELAESKGCKACHSLDGSVGIGPSWLHSYGSLRTFVDGSTGPVDEDYLRESMQQPAARVVAGLQNVMVAGVLSEDEMSMLIALIRSLAADASP